MRRNKGITLIELLIVVAIIAILVALGMSVYGMAKRSAIESREMTNLKSIGLAALAYSADYSDHIAFGSNEQSKVALQHQLKHQLATQIGESQTIVQLLKPILSASEIWKSNFDCFSQPPAGELDCSKTYFLEYGSSYIFDESNGLRSRSLSELNTPSTCVAFGDADRFRTPTGAVASAKMLVVFHDGHVKSEFWSVGTEAYCDAVGFTGSWK